MPLSHLFDDTFRQELEVITQDSTLSDRALHNGAERYLEVLAHPCFEDINQPAWVRRIQPLWVLSITYTSSKLFDALYHTADELGLVAGMRYVSATICLCANRAESVAASLEDRPRRIAEALSQLATAWIAFMLWPFFVDGVKASEELLAKLELERGVLQSDNAHSLVVKEDLLKRSGYTCFMSGNIHFRAPREQMFRGPDYPTIDDLQVTQIFRPPCTMRERGMREDDEVVTSDILKHYCDPICVYGVEVKEGEIEARNSLVMGVNSCTAFNSFRWCLHPSPVLNKYHIEVHQRNELGTQYVASPFVFEDYSHKYSYSPDGPPQDSAASLGSSSVNPPSPRAHRSRRKLDFPSAELLRVHAALAGAMQLSGAIKAFDAIYYSCHHVDESCIPGASGRFFLQSVVAYEGREVCSDVETWKSGKRRIPVEEKADVSD